MAATALPLLVFSILMLVFVRGMGIKWVFIGIGSGAAVAGIVAATALLVSDDPQPAHYTIVSAVPGQEQGDAGSCLATDGQDSACRITDDSVLIATTDDVDQARAIAEADGRARGTDR